MQFGIHNWAEIISALIAAGCWVYKPLVINKWFALFLWVTVIVELAGKLTTPIPAIKIPMYNIFNGVEFFFYLSFILFINEGRRMKMFMRFNLAIFGLFFLSNLFFWQRLYTYNSHTHTFGAILIILSSLLMFYKVSASEINHFGIIKWPFLWITSGLLIFYVGNFFNTAMFNYMTANDPSRAVTLYRLINHSCNVVLYSTFSVAFVMETLKSKSGIPIISKGV